MNVISHFKKEGNWDIFCYLFLVFLKIPVERVPFQNVSDFSDS